MSKDRRELMQIVFNYGNEIERLRAELEDYRDAFTVLWIDVGPAERFKWDDTAVKQFDELLNSRRLPWSGGLAGNPR